VILLGREADDLFENPVKERKRRTTSQVTGQVAARVLQFCEQPREAGEIQDLLWVKHRQTFRENYLNVLLSKGWLSRPIPEKSKSRLQRYQTTPDGKNWLQAAATGLITGAKPVIYPGLDRPLRGSPPVLACCQSDQKRGRPTHHSRSA
jgi:hypothetical protein